MLSNLLDKNHDNLIVVLNSSSSLNYSWYFSVFHSTFSFNNLINSLHPNWNRTIQQNDLSRSNFLWKNKSSVWTDNYQFEWHKKYVFSSILVINGSYTFLLFQEAHISMLLSLESGQFPAKKQLCSQTVYLKTDPVKFYLVSNLP